MKHLLVALGIALSGGALWLISTGLARSIRRNAGYVLLAYGLAMACWVGTATSLVAPGIGSITLGAAGGAATGWIAYMVIGTVGIATGGTAFALGLCSVITGSALLGAIGGAAGGFGLRQHLVWVIHPIFWLPLLPLGIVLVRGAAANGKNVNPPSLR